MSAPVQNYVYPSTDRVVHGAGAIASLDAECTRLGAERVLLLTTPSLHGSTIAAQVAASIGDRLVGELPSATQHVPLDAVTGTITAAAELRPDLLVSLGGGSVIDLGKAVAAALGAGITSAEGLVPHRILFQPPDAISQEPFIGEPIRHIAIPTTLSAAEYDGIFGMTRDSTKDLYADPRLSPTVAILDPDVTAMTPATLWTSTGIRALDHAVEIYLSTAPSPVTDAACLHATRLLVENLAQTIADPSDMAARARCQHAAWLSMIGVENVTLGLCHGIGHQLGARCGVPHGITSCVMLPTVLGAMIDVQPERMADLAAIFGADRTDRPVRDVAAELPGLIRDMISGLGLPTRLADVGVEESQFDALAQDSIEDFVVAFAPIKVEKPDVVRLLQAAM